MVRKDSVSRREWPKALRGEERHEERTPSGLGNVEAALVAQPGQKSD